MDRNELLRHTQRFREHEQEKIHACQNLKSQAPLEQEGRRHTMVKIRKLGHVGIFVRDVEKSKKFYTEILGFKVSDVNEQGITFLRCSTDHHDTVLVPLPERGQGSDQEERREIQQISYEVDRIEDLREALKELKEKGVTIVSGLRQRGPGNDKTIDFRDPDGNNIQLYCEMDQIGWDSVSKPKEMWERKEL